VNDGYTTDPADPRLGHGVDPEPIEQHEVYLILSDEERAKGFVRPVRTSYRHVGPAGSRSCAVDCGEECTGHSLRDLTDEERSQQSYGYVKFEEYQGEGSVTGRYWTQEQLDAVGKGCGSVTTMGLSLAETYARNPHFYGATYCCFCRKHLAVAEFVWERDGSRVGS
jgi:hypothetical protein